LSFLLTESRAALDDLGHFVARLKQGSAIETERFRQAQYLKWCKQKLVPDPCGAELGYDRLVACFIKKYRGLPIPANLFDKENMTSKLIHIREREETIARHRSPISKEMFVAIANHACNSDRDSAKSVIFDWITLGRVAGFQVAEYAQTMQNKGLTCVESQSGKKKRRWNPYDRDRICASKSFTK
jgi:hypothetical protein